MFFYAITAKLQFYGLKLINSHKIVPLARKTTTIYKNSLLKFYSVNFYKRFYQNTSLFREPITRLTVQS